MENDQSGFGGRSLRGVAVASYGGKASEEHKRRRMRSVLRTLYFGLRSVQLVHDVYVHQWSIESGVVLAVL